MPRTIFLVYISHAFSAWGDRMWDFFVGIFLAILYPNSLLVTAIFGFTTSFSVIAFGGILGSWIDSTNRIRATTGSIIVQNVAAAFGAAELALLYIYREDIETKWGNVTLYIGYVLIILSSIIVKLASVASDIAVERDWIVVLAQGDENGLANMNAVMRTIDLTTKILAPMAVGGLIALLSPVYGSIFVAGWNLLSGILEVYLLYLVYKAVPELSAKRVSTQTDNAVGFSQIWTGWKLYSRQPLKWAGIGFSCVYMSVLGFDQITIGYMYSQGVGESLNGILLAMAAITGILGSMSYPSIRRHIGLTKTVFTGYIALILCFLLCVISVFISGSPFDPSSIAHVFGTINSTSSNEQSLPLEHDTFDLAELWEQRQNIVYFAIGIVLARFGLWLVDLSITQLFQDKVEENRRGVINGVQNAINQTMDTLKFFLVILFPLPQTFGYLIFLTWGFACLGWICHIFYTKKVASTSHKEQRKIEEGYENANAISEDREVSNEFTPLLDKRER